MNYFRRLVILGLLSWGCGLPMVTLAQTNEGTDFWLGFMEHIDVRANTKVVMVTAKEATAVTIAIPGLAWSRTLTLEANEVELVEVPQDVEQLGTGKARLGIHVTSDLPVAVYTHQYANFRSEAAVILPVNSVGTSYRVLTYRGYQSTRGELYPSQFMIIANEDSTVISFNPTTEVPTGPSGVSQQIVLNRGETYQVQSTTPEGDLSGSLVAGNAPFTLLAGAAWTEVPNGCAARDNLIEQMYPLSSWGRRYVLATFAKTNFDVIRVMAAEDQTSILQDGLAVAQLNAGEFWEFQLGKDQLSFIEGNKPIQVAQFIPGNTCGQPGTQENGDPSMVLLNPVEQTRNEITLYSSSFENIGENYLNLIIRTDDANTIMLDGNSVSGFNPVPSKPDFSVARIAVSAGPHVLSSGGCGIIATAYGYGNVESYAYAAGATLVPINGYALPEGGCLNDTVFFGEGLDPERYEAIWDFGDGSSSAELQTSHIYRSLGTYPVTLYLTDRCLVTRDTLKRDLLVSLRQDLNAFGDTAVCQGATVTLTASDLPNATYEWTTPQRQLIVGQNPQLEFVTSQDSGTYEVVGIISGCATFPQPIWVDVRPTPFPNLGPDRRVCGTGPFELSVPGQFANYRWNDGTVTANYTALEPGTYSVVVSDDIGCEGQDEIELAESCPARVFVPSAFSPNGDGINEELRFVADFTESFTFSVFNRWGHLLHQTQTLDNPWRGTDQRGALLSEGVYIWQMVYEIQSPGEQRFFRQATGTVTLIR